MPAWRSNSTWRRRIRIARRWPSASKDRWQSPELILVEVGQALLRHCREGRLDLAGVKTALSDLASITQQPVPTADLMPRALDLAASLVHGLHDCLYLALAEYLSCPLLTADAKLAGKVERANLPISLVLLTDRAL